MSVEIDANVPGGSTKTKATLLPSVAPDTMKMVIVHAVPCMYSDIQRQVLLLRKPDLSKYHPGFLNLPGGHVEPDEAPVHAAVRKLKEETGLDGTWPQYMGCIRSPLDDQETEDDFVVYAYRMQVSQRQPIVSEPDQPVNWYRVSRLAELMASPPQKIVPNLPILLPLLIAGLTRGWVLTETHNSFASAETSFNFPVTMPNVAYKSRNP